MARGLLILANSALALMLAECAARCAEWLHPSSDAVAFAYSPYRMLKMKQAPWPLNSAGFRAEELETYGAASGHDSFLIEFLGGSVCLGVGNNPGEPLPERIEGALKAAHMGRVRVLNLCQGGATSAQELAILIEYGLPLQPQAVLFFDGANDILHPGPVGEDDAPNLPYLNSQMEARVDGRDALSHLALARVAARLSQRFYAVASSGKPVAVSAIVDSYLYHLSLARTLSESKQAFFAVLFQPTLHFDKTWSQEEADMWRTRRPHDGAYLSRIIQERYAHARNAAIQWSGMTGTSFFDLTAAFKTAPESIYSDSVHFRGSRGYELLTAELARQGLLERLRERYQAWEAEL